MYQDNTVAVVVPAYNESGLVGGVLESMPEFVDRVYAVDDCSSDETWTEIRQHAVAANARSSVSGNGAGKRTDDVDLRSIPEGGGSLRAATDAVSKVDAVGDTRPVVAIRHAQNRGPGAAIKTGYRHALADGMDVVAVMDGDGQMDPAYLESILAPVVSGEADYAKGNRLGRPEHRVGMSRWRQFGNALLTLLTRVASGYWKMSDPQNGYTAISSEALESVPIDDLYDRYGFLNDLLATLNRYGMTVADVDHPAQYGEERSGIRYRTFVPMLSALLLRNFVARVVETYAPGGTTGLAPHPAFLGYSLGVAGIVGGVAAGVRAAVGGTDGPSLAPALAALVAGVALLILGVVADARRNDFLHVSDDGGESE